MAVIVLATGVCRPAEADPSAAQVAFVNAVAQSQMLELQAAKLAVEVSKNRDITRYAYRLIGDYQRMHEDLVRIAGKRGIAFQGELDTEHGGVLQALRDTPAPQFDAAYLVQVLRDLDTTADLFKANLLNSDTEIAVFSSYNLPRIGGHRMLGEQLKAGGSG